ncbi:hypothetical protein HK097_011625 [Rhizophlyctis rosea]|uniref:Uncharacterized protein n=1 Tax=Rhizophlyctis rosea TaxID=64517 RepID=A0AAD5SI21_9FUNG|nr:hypothetical protein HK097_011625 [Rhizophlyctis rosea]
MEALLADLLDLKGRDQYNRGRDLARQGIELASIRSTHGAALSLQGPNDEKAANSIAAAVLIGGIGGLQELRVDILADLVHSRLRYAKDALSTHVLYAFFLAGSQPSEAISTIFTAIEYTESIQNDKVLSRLLTMRGWLHAMAKDPGVAELAEADFTSAIKLDESNLGALRLHARTCIALKQHSAAVDDLNAFVAKVKADNIEDMPGVATAWYDLVEALFRRGPKAEGVGGISGLLRLMENAFEEGQKVESSSQVATSEAAEMLSAKLRSEQMIAKVRSLIR